MTESQLETVALTVSVDELRKFCTFFRRKYFLQQGNNIFLLLFAKIKASLQEANGFCELKFLPEERELLSLYQAAEKDFRMCILLEEERLRILAGQKDRERKLISSLLQRGKSGGRVI